MWKSTESLRGVERNKELTRWGRHNEDGLVVEHRARGGREAKTLGTGFYPNPGRTKEGRGKNSGSKKKQGRVKKRDGIIRGRSFKRVLKEKKMIETIISRENCRTPQQA